MGASGHQVETVPASRCISGRPQVAGREPGLRHPFPIREPLLLPVQTFSPGGARRPRIGGRRANAGGLWPEQRLDGAALVHPSARP